MSVTMHRRKVLLVLKRVENRMSLEMILNCVKWELYSHVLTVALVNAL